MWGKTSFLLSMSSIRLNRDLGLYAISRYPKGPEFDAYGSRTRRSLARLQNRFRRHVVMLDDHHRFPSKAGWILNDPDLGRRTAVEDHVEPEVLLEPLGSLELVGGEGHFPDTRPALDFDEADFDRRLWVFRMGAPRNQVEAAVIGFNARHLPPARFFVSCDGLDGYCFDFIVLDHGRELRCCPFGVR